MESTWRVISSIKQKTDISTNKIMDFIRFEAGNIYMVTGGANTGRVGIIMNRERHQGSFDIVRIKDNNGHTFTTRRWDSVQRRPNQRIPRGIPPL